jgi:hypothetical protein
MTEYAAEAARLLKKAEGFVTMTRVMTNAERESYKALIELARMYVDLASINRQAGVSDIHVHSMQGYGGTTTGPAIER